ncbi:unnamed protein product [Mesocestoides corti]|uniref:Uncharacterized protein n=1 Tax=Mesocestoides corti TaxID=53468 RepID=A0A0R3U1N9_MESCO|nr:unnamed protein product [Mesocestoides corti]
MRLSQNDIKWCQCGGVSGTFVSTCNAQTRLIDVRSISKGISYLNDKLDTIASLTEPRENAFLRYQDNPAVPRPSPVGRTNSVAIEASPAQAQSHHPDPGTAGFVDVARCLAAFGRIAVSTTYPPLCTATLPSEVHINLPSKVLVRAFDYHGQPQTTGTDPIVVRFVDAHGREAPSQLVDLGNGSYEITILPINAGPHKLSVNIISRPIRGSPFRIAVRSRQKPRWSINEGLDGRGLVQPFAVSVVRSSRFPPAPAPAATTNTTSSSSLPSSEASSSSSTLNGYESGGCGVDEVAQSNGSCVPAAGDGGGGDAPFPSSSSSDCVLLLDTGNSRLLVADGETGQVTSALVNDALKGQAATGMALCPEGLWVVNWRANELLLLDIATNEVRSSAFLHFICTVIRRRVSSPHFVEPTSVCVCPRTGRVLVADNGAGCVFACLDGTVTALIGASCCDTATAPTTAAAGTAGGRGARQFDRLVHDALRRVTGLCVMSSGEIVLAAGSELRIYSSEGAHIGNLYPPLGAGFLQLPQQPPSSTNGDGFPSHPNQNSLRQAQCTTLVPPIVGLSSAPGSTLTLDSAAHRPLRRPPSVGGSMRPSSGVGVAGALRGHFGGVTAAPRATSDLGECLLASHTDRTRSAVVVYPEAAWRGAITGVSGGGADGYTATNSTESMRDDCLRDLGASLMRQVKRQPYVLEVEPGLRRLAGLIAFPTASTIVAVDLGGQCAHCLRYA